MNKKNLDLFARHVSLEQFGSSAQQKLLDAEVCVVGCGGLGSAVLPYLVAGGVGKITFLDQGEVEISNLQRQPLYGVADIGREKVDVAYEQLQRISHSSALIPVSAWITAENIQENISDGVDLVIDCTDNFAVRYLLADYLWQKKVTLLSAAVLEYAGHIFTLRNKEGNPCLRCLMPQPPENYRGASEVGVLGPAVGVMGCMQAVEAVKILTETGDDLETSFLTFDFFRMRVNKMQRQQDPACRFCAKN